MSRPAKVVFINSDIVERKFKDFTARQQTGYLKISDHVSHEIAVRIPDDGKAYAPGTYVIGAESFRTDDYGRLAISKKGIVLVPDVAPGK